MSEKIIVCRCEDVTLAEIESALALGYDTVDEVKRLTGFGTGPCQGKECQTHVAHLIAARTGTARLAPFTARPPFAPTPLRLFAGVRDTAEGSANPFAPTTSETAPPTRASNARWGEPHEAVPSEGGRERPPK